jgi:hypothetical protein
MVVNGRKFLPLVRSSLDLACGLEILFLRKQEPGSVINSGDIDNRLKVLFDGLRVPSSDEMSGATPAGDPLYCLLEQDSLINDCDIRTDRLLSRPGSNDNEVRLIIEVTVKVMRVQPYNMAILGD